MDGTRARELALGGALDYDEIGFRCGLEIHQQLDTRKLFSPCPSGVLDPDEVAAGTVARVHRRLRATRSELGQVDVAALAEARRERTFQYLAIQGLSSLVELDDEPPHPLCPESLDVALTFAGLLGSRPADEVHVMRKTVIDGSNTSGFQRTALVATGGVVDVAGPSPVERDGHGDARGQTHGDAQADSRGDAHGDDPRPTGHDVGVWTIALEEDSARKLDDEGAAASYTLDRLGVPLIEVATAPDIRDPQHAQRTAARIGALLRATGRVRRGLGTIRQDLNVSVSVGDRVEIKGCQDLRAIPSVIEKECRRQLWMHYVAEELAARGFTEAGAASDVSAAFAACDAKLVQGALKRGQRVWGLPLPHWAGLVGGAKDAPRVGREFADHAKVAAGVKGIFHSDELPAYGIGQDEVDAARGLLGCTPDDAFVLCVADTATATKALDAVAARARAAIDGAIREVRAAQPDDSTRYMRPMPGAARMYPETDVPPTRITHAMWDDLLRRLPLRPEERVAALQREFQVHAETAGQLVRDDLDEAFRTHVQDGAEAGLVARVLLQVLPSLSDPGRVSHHVGDVLARLRAGHFAKEAVPDILAALDVDPARSVDEAVADAGAEAASEGEVEDVVRRVVAQRMDFVTGRGMAAMGPLMGPVMAELRGKVDGKVVSKALQDELRRVLG